MTLLPEPVPGFQTPATTWPGANGPGAATPVSAEQVSAWREQFISLILRQVVLAFTNILPGGADAFDQLKEWSDGLADRIVSFIDTTAGIDLSSWAAFIASLNDGEGIDLPNIATLLAKIESAFDGIDLDGDPGAILASVATAIADAIAEALTDVPVFGDIAAAIAELVAKLVNGGQPITASNLFGQILPKLLGPVPAGHVTGAQPNIAPGFDAPFPTINGWTHDATVKYGDQPASARLDADGAVHLMLSDPIEVATGDKLKLTVPVKWEDLSATGTPVEFGLLPNTSPTVTVLGSRAAGSSGIDWTPTVGSVYTVAGDVRSVQIAYRVNASAADGTVHLGEPEMIKTNLIKTSLIADADGNGLPDIIDNVIDGAESNLQEFKDRLVGIADATPTNIDNWLLQLLKINSPINGSNITTGTIADARVGGVLALLDGIVNNVAGRDGSGFGRSDANAALQAQTEALIAANAAVVQLMNDRTAGVSAADDFERTSSSTLGSLWSVTTSGSGGGTLATPNGHDAAVTRAILNSNEKTYVARWIGTNATSNTDYQRVAIVLGSQPEDPTLGSPAANDVLLRMGAGSVDFIRIRFRADRSVRISRVVSGTETLMASGSLPFTPTAGTILTGEAGKAGTARYFRALVNNSPVLDVTESGTGSLLDSNHRGWGFGMFAGSAPVPVLTNALPGSVRQWVAADQ